MNVLKYMSMLYIHPLLIFTTNISGYRKLGASVSEQTKVNVSGL